jgi:anti-anti-sigma factor
MKHEIPELDEDRGITTLHIKAEYPEGLPGCVKLLPVGIIDTYNTPSFTKKLSAVLDHPFQKIWIDCRGINYMSSTGVGAFSGLLKSVRAQNKQLVISNLQESVYAVFQLLGFSQFFEITRDDNEAIRLLQATVLPSPNDLLPGTGKCPICEKSLKLAKAGRFRCPTCGTTLTVSEKGTISL